MLHLIISTQSFVFLMLASFLAGFLDAIAGGGGLITIPAYLISGLPVHMVYACNKFASSCGTAIATLRYYRNKMVDIPVGLLAAAGAFVCSAIAAKIVLVLDAHTLKTMLLVILPVAAVITLINKNMGNDNHSDRFGKRKKYALSVLIGGLIGLYDGLFGPGHICTDCLLPDSEIRYADSNRKRKISEPCVQLCFSGSVYSGRNGILEGCDSCGSAEYLRQLCRRRGCHKKRRGGHPQDADCGNRTAVY